MSRKMFVKKMMSCLELGKNRPFYVEYIDSGGNHLKKNEILFTDEDGVKLGEQIGKKNYCTVDSPGVKPIYDSSGNFPIALETADGKVLHTKISAKTLEVLPIHAGGCYCVDVVYTGPPGAGKTVNILQISDSGFHNAIVKHTNCSIQDDLPDLSISRKNYVAAGKNLKKHILPDPTRRGEMITPYVYYVTYIENGEKRHILLRFQDVDGQECLEMGYNSKILPYNYFFLTIPADELISEDAEAYTKVLNNMISKLRVVRRDMDYEIMVIITKSDLLNKNNIHLKDAFENSIVVKNGRIVQKTHDRGFNYEAFNRRGEAVKAYLMDECPNLYNELTNEIPENKLTFAMIASIGSSCEGNKFDEWLPFCIDEPVLAILAKNNMYPVSKTVEVPKPVPIEPVFSFKKLIKNLSEIEEFEDYENYNDEDIMETEAM